MVTAEHKVNRFGSHYSYYHCTKKRMDYHCGQPVIPEKDLEQQVIDFLEGITPPERLHKWAMSRLGKQYAEQATLQAVQRQSAQKTVKSVNQQLENLTRLRLRDLVTDEEYIRQRQELERERVRLLQNEASEGGVNSSLEPDRLVISFNQRAASWFKTGNPKTRRFILEIIGSNPTLKDKQLNIEAMKPFRRWGITATISQMCGFVKDVRTLWSANDKTFRKMVDQIRLLHDQLEPQTKHLAA